MLGVIGFAVAATLIWYYFIRPLSFWTRLGVKQTKPWIFFGDSLPSILRMITLNDFVQKVYNMHRDTRYSGFYTFNNPVLVLRDPELIKNITIKDFEHFTDHRPFVDAGADPLWSNALVSLSGDRWKEMRNTLSPTFTSSKIKSIFTLMVETSENFVKYFLENDDEIIEVKMKDAFSRFTNDVIATTTFGVQVNSLKDGKNTFYIMGKKLTSLTGLLSMFKFLGHQAFPKIFKFLGIPFLDKAASKYFYGVVDETIKAREDNGIVRSDMMQLMLEARKKNKDQATLNKTGKNKEAVLISNKELTSQAMIFFFGGFDTISTTMCFCSYELAVNKEIQDRLREEVRATQKDGKVTYDELMRMKYMDMVVSEILRKWPPFPFVNRLCTKPYMIEPISKDEKQVLIPAKQELWIPIYGLQMDPKYFPNPEKIDPERFSDENKNNIIPYTYLPFGAGPRNCIGNRFALLEVKALLFNILLHYEIVPTKNTPIPLLLSKDLSMIPEDTLFLGLKRIKV